MNRMNKKHKITSFGSGVLDIHSAPFDSNSGADKRDGDLEFKVGGAPVNGARAAGLYVTVALILLIADDFLGKIIKELAFDEFKEQTLLLHPAMEATRASVISGNSIITKRASTIIQDLPVHIREICANSEMLIVGPMTQKDYELTKQILKTNSNSILQLSKQQLENAGMCIQLAQMAGVTVINDNEATYWTGFSDPVKAIQWLRDRSVKNVIITSKDSVNGYCDGNWIFQPTIQAKNVKSTIGAGDVFVGTLAAMRVNGKSWRKAITLAMTAATRHIEKSGVTDLSRLDQESLTRKRVPFQPPKSKFKVTAPINKLTVAASSLIAGLAFGILM
ncbi:carbohydrate kinase family protein [Gimesia sp.]|uniref:carbohydrate kinase family protein n=1 Tax=Gimesia sp. TaxID=2024833 RepID=UPI003A909979